MIIRLNYIIIIFICNISCNQPTSNLALKDENSIVNLSSIDTARVNKDREFFEKISKAHNENKSELFKLLNFERRKKQFLGFGYFLIEGNVGREYFPIFYDILLLEDSILSYSLKIKKATIESELIAQSKIIESTDFKLIEDYWELTYNPNLQSSPIISLLLPKSRAYDRMNFDLLMSPESGVEYGIIGGYGGQILENRMLINNLKPQLTDDNYKYLLASKNPATRMYAIEYFSFKYGDKLEQDNTLSKIIDKILYECPMIYTFNGSNRIKVDSKSLLKNTLKKL